MALVVPNNSESIMLQYITNNDAPENLVIRLYANDVTPDENSTVNTFTEVTGNGYSSQNLMPGSWNFEIGKPCGAQHTEVIWNLSADVGPVYGYYIIRATGGELMWAERFPKGPFVVDTNGDEIRVKPILTLE